MLGRVDLASGGMRREPVIDEASAERVLKLLRGHQGAVDSTTAPQRLPGWLPEPPTGAAPVIEPSGMAPPAGGRGAERSGRSDSTRPVGRHRAVSRPLLTLPASLRRSRVTPGARAVVAVLVVATLGAVGFAVRVAAAERAAEPVAIPRGSGLVARVVATSWSVGTGAAGPAAGSPDGATAGVGATAAPAGSGPPGAGRIVVHVVGEVAKPGIVLLAPGARVVDAVTAAGGALPSGQLERINLARVVSDGEQVHVPNADEPLLPGAVGSSASAGSVGPAGPIVDLNRADLAALDSLPGVGPVLAQRILDWRREHGRFTSVDELGEVSGIGEQLLRQLASRVTV